MKAYQQGIGLPELIISLLLTSFIMVILMQHYLHVKHHYHRIKTSLEQTIDLLLVTDLMRNSIRRAGFTPCLGLEQLVTVDSRDVQRHLRAVEMGTKAQSWVRISRMSEYFDSVFEVVNATHLLTTSYQSIYPNQSVLIADCYHAEVQTVKQIRHGPNGRIVIIDNPLIFTYKKPIYLGEWLDETYAIRQGENNNNSLFYQRYHPEELSTVIHSLLAYSFEAPTRGLLKVTLGLGNLHQIVLETRVRAA